MQKPWPLEQVTQAIALWLNGLPASAIGRRLGKTRNSVIGKMSRLGIPAPSLSQRVYGKRGARARKKNSPQPKLALKKTFHKPLPLPLPPLLCMPPARATGAAAALYRLRHADCRWPIGDPRADDFRFCGAVAEPGSSYCEHHYITSINPSWRDQQ